MAEKIKQAKADLLLQTVRDWSKQKFYQKGQGGIPYEDLDADVQASLDLADSALQAAALTPYRTASDQDVIDLGIKNRLDAVEGVIPGEATSSNKLADKAFVNSSIATATATFKGTLDAATDLKLTKPATHEQIVAALAAHTFTPAADNNDYCFVVNSDAQGATLYERYKFNGTAWEFEYALNNSSFTAAQWAAINSGVTSDKVGAYDMHIASENNPHNVTKGQVGLGNVDNTSDADKPVSTAQQAALDEKEDVISASHKISSDFVDDTDKTHKFVSAAEKEAWNDKYDKPSTGIPGSDLADAYGDAKNPYASKSANQVLAAPDGSAGVPSFRALVFNDISDAEFMTSAEMLAILNA